MPTADEIIKLLGLAPHPGEGGYFRETYRAAETVPAKALDQGYGGARAHSTAIYYLLTPETFSAMHRLRGDEVFHFYLGDPVEMLQLKADGTGEMVILGPDVGAGMRPQHVVPAGVWQGCRLVKGQYALLGTTVAPGFEFEDFETGNRAQLTAEYPQFSRLIAELTRR